MANILILEDDRELTEDWREAFVAAGHQVWTTESAASAIELLKEIEFDFLLVDIFIRRSGKLVPDGGVKLIAHLRKNSSVGAAPWWRTVPILAISGAMSVHGGYDPLETARAFGATSWVRKPISPKRLVDAAEQMMSGVTDPIAPGA